MNISANQDQEDRSHLGREVYLSFSEFSFGQNVPVKWFLFQLLLVVLWANVQGILWCSISLKSVCDLEQKPL